MSVSRPPEGAARAPGPSSDLIVRLDTELPPALPVGRGTAIFCAGTCFHRHEPIRDLEILVAGASHRPTAWRMPRPDLFGSLHAGLADGAGAERHPGSTEDPELRSYRSGFWSTIPLEARERPHTVALELRARLESGGEAMAALGKIAFAAPDPPPPAPPGAPARPGLIAICMATFEPDMALFRTQVESLREQTDDGWACVISDDCSSAGHLDEIRRVVADDPRFVISPARERLGFYRNFERALRLAPAEAELVALCDQDDYWHPDKLDVLRGGLGAAGLVYSDQRLVDADGRLLRETLWAGRRNNHTNLASLLVANTITGAATLFRREVAELALPFPDTPGFQFHDHWIGLVALASGEVAYVDRPLYDYVQHPGAIFGHVTRSADPPLPGARRRRSRPRAPEWRGLLTGWRGAYFYGYLSREVQAQTLLARCGTRISPPKRRALERFVASQDRPLPFAWLATRPVRCLLGRTETLGSEAGLARGIVWRWTIAARAGRAERPGRRPSDASLPALGSFEQKRLRRWRARV